jgi:hypothetical protein
VGYKLELRPAQRSRDSNSSNIAAMHP